MSGIGIAITDNKKKQGGLFAGLRATQKTPQTTTTPSAPSTATVQGAGGGANTQTTPAQGRTFAQAWSVAQPQGADTEQTGQAATQQQPQTSAPQKPKVSPEWRTPEPSLYNNNNTQDKTTPRLDYSNADPSKPSLYHVPNYKAVSAAAGQKQDEEEQQGAGTDAQATHKADEEEQVSTIADFLASRPSKSVEDYERERERRDRVERISRGLKALANVFTTAHGGVSTYDYAADKAESDKDENKNYERLVKSWKDYREGLQRAHNIAYKQQDSDTRKGNLLWRQAKQQNDQKKWQDEYSLKLRKLSADEAYKQALVDLKQQQQKLQEEKNEDNKKLIEARIKYLDNTIAVQKQRIKNQNKTKTTTYTRDAKGRVTKTTIQ